MKVLKLHFGYSILEPHDGHAGDWTSFSATRCNGNNNFINGVAIEIFKKGGMFSDARGATNLKMVCADGTILEASNNDKRYSKQ